MASGNIPRAHPAEPAGPRTRALVRRIAELDCRGAPESGRLDAIALGLVDVLLEHDEEALRAGLDALRDARARALDDVTSSDGKTRLLGSLDAMSAVAHWGQERLTPEATLATVACGTRAHDFLRALDRSDPVGSSELRQIIETDETQVSRTGRHLLEAGLVSRRKAGRGVFWALTPRGKRALELVPTPAPRPVPGRIPEASAFWFEALRRGFEGAGGDEPGERRGVDPTTERIVACTRALHAEQGIRATTWPQIAARARVTEEEIFARFPAKEDLLRGCGEQVFMALRLPPPDRVVDVFAGASSEGERVSRLVGAIFDAYERTGAELEHARAERAALPALEQPLRSLDVALDALVAEALGSRSSGTEAIASVRALTDLAVWRTLRERGASAEGAAEQARLTVERWLEPRSSTGPRKC